MAETKNIKKKLTPSQEYVFQQIQEQINNFIDDLDYSNILLTGSAGTGKTFTICKCIYKLKKILQLNIPDKFNKFIQKETTKNTLTDEEETQNILNIIIISPTHKAKNIIKNQYEEYITSKNYIFEKRGFGIYIDIKFWTIPRFLNMKQIYDKQGNSHFIYEDTNKSRNITPFLFIDEAGMVNKEQAKKLLTTFSHVFKVFLGDEYQLLPVKEKNSHIFKEFKQKKLELTEIMRTGNKNLGKAYKLTRKFSMDMGQSDIYKLFYKLNRYIIFCSSKHDFFNKIKENYDIERGDMCLTYSNISKDKYNAEIRKQKINSPQKYSRGDRIIFDKFHKHKKDNEQFKYLYPSDIFVIKNIDVQKHTIEQEDYDVYNMEIESICGNKEILYIKKVIDEPRYKKMISKYKKNTKKYIEKHSEKIKQGCIQPSEIQTIWDNFYLHFNQYNVPISHAYALTIYKSQGSTYENVFIDISNITDCLYPRDKNQYSKAIYTSITRAKKNVYII